jgi:hydrogenase/urease accessory protein HupE
MRPVSRRLIRLLLLFACLFAFPATAHAHSPIKGMGDFINGLLHPLTTPSQVLLIVGLGLLAGRLRPFNLKAPMAVFIALSGAALILGTVGRVKSVHPAVLLGIAFCAGTLLALDKNPDTLPFCALFAVGAMAMGLDSAVESGSAASMAKTLLGNWISLVVLVCVIAIYVSLGGEAKWLKVALRIFGSWIIAISLLVMAFSFRK